MNSSAKPETHYEKHRQLQLKLDQDQRELEILQSSLTKTGAFSEKIVSYR